MSQSPPLLCAFDATHRHFLSITLDNRIKLWDVLTGNLLQTYQEDQHLAQHYTSIAWTHTQPSPAPSKKSKATPPPSSTPALGYLALGSKTGAVSVFNLSTGDCTHASPTASSSSKVQSSPILAVSFHGNHAVLLASSADNSLHRFSFPSLTLLSTVVAPSPVTLMPSLPHPPSASSLLVALGPSLALVDLNSTSSFTVQHKWSSAVANLVSVDGSGDGKLYSTGQSNEHNIETASEAGLPLPLGSCPPAKAMESVECMWQ